MSESVTLSGEFAVAKTDDDAQVVFGWASVAQKADGTAVVDSDNELIDPAALETAAYDFVLTSREGGADHTGAPVGRLVESIVFTAEKQEALGLAPGTLPIGWFVGYKIDDPSVWASVKSAERVMFSIDATALIEDAGPVAA